MPFIVSEHLISHWYLSYIGQMLIVIYIPQSMLYTIHGTGQVTIAVFVLTFTPVHFLCSMQPIHTQRKMTNMFPKNQTRPCTLTAHAHIWSVPSQYSHM